MTIWEIINSPFMIAITGLIWGSIITSWISASWQRRAYRHEIKLQCAKNIISIYHEYVRLLKGPPELLAGKEFDSINGRLYTEIKIAKLIFKNKGIAHHWKSVAGSLANIRKLCQEKSNLVGQKLDDVYDKASTATELTFKELA